MDARKSYKKELFLTEDGSHTLYVRELNEYYHSWFGSLAESKYVYLEQGFHFWCSQHPEQRTLRLLEMGFGTGLNAWLTCLEHKKKSDKKRSIHYTSLEIDPLRPEEYEKLNFSSLSPFSSEDHILFNQLHRAKWEQDVCLFPGFTLFKWSESLLEASFAEPYDLVYFDAFGPTVQPELWSEAVFQKLFAALNTGGVLVTYASKGTVKQALRNAGFALERLPGSPHKHHMLRAIKL